MNERIKEIAKQAYEDVIKNTPSFLVTKELYEQKFAELIVAECAEQSMVIGKYNTSNGVTPDLAIAIAVGLKKHFGLEEESDEEAHVRIERELAETMRDLGIKEEPTINETLRNRSTYFGNDI
jgi:hypothetical protein